MWCPRCEHENPQQAKFYFERLGIRLPVDRGLYYGQLPSFQKNQQTKN